MSKVLFDQAQVDQCIKRGGIVKVVYNDGSMDLLKDGLLNERVVKIILEEFTESNWPILSTIRLCGRIPKHVKSEAINTALEIANNFVLGRSNSYGDKGFVYPNALAFHWNSTPQGYNWWKKVYDALHGKDTFGVNVKIGEIEFTCAETVQTYIDGQLIGVRFSYFDNQNELIDTIWQNQSTGKVIKVKKIINNSVITTEGTRILVPNLDKYYQRVI